MVFELDSINLEDVYFSKRYPRYYVDTETLIVEGNTYSESDIMTPCIEFVNKKVSWGITSKSGFSMTSYESWGTHLRMQFDDSPFLLGITDTGDTYDVFITFNNSSHITLWHLANSTDICLRLSKKTLEVLEYSSENYKLDGIRYISKEEATIRRDNQPLYYVCENKDGSQYYIERNTGEKSKSLTGNVAKSLLRSQSSGYLDNKNVSFTQTSRKQVKLSNADLSQSIEVKYDFKESTVFINDKPIYESLQSISVTFQGFDYMEDYYVFHILMGLEWLTLYVDKETFEIYMITGDNLIWGDFGIELRKGRLLM